jgi:hypothetical protein
MVGGKGNAGLASDAQGGPFLNGKGKSVTIIAADASS